MNKEVDYKSIISDLNELLDRSKLSNRFSFNYETTGWYDRICFGLEVLWCSSIDSMDDENDCDWTTETLLQHCIMEFKRYRTLLNTIEIK